MRREPESTKPRRQFKYGEISVLETLAVDVDIHKVETGGPAIYYGVKLDESVTNSQTCYNALCCDGRGSQKA